MSQFISLDQADFVQPVVTYDEFAAVTSVIKSIRSLNQNLENLKQVYQTGCEPVDFTVKKPA